MARTKSSGRQFLDLLESLPNPCYALDDDRRLIHCNSACCDWLRRPRDELVGMKCDFHSGDIPHDEIAAQLCPPPEAIQQQRTRICIVDNTDNPLSRRMAEVVPLPGSDGEPLGVIVFVEDEESADRTAADSAMDLDALELHHRLRRLVAANRRRFRLNRLAGDSVAIQRVRRQVLFAISTASHTLIVGPEGSGREHIARTIHVADQPDDAGPLMPLSASVLDGELLQTTVLAFLRRCQESDPDRPATILLLDVDQLSKAAQAELLAFFRIPTFGLRTVATSRCPLVELAGEGSFNQELAFLLSTLVIELPHLSDRREDIPLLVQQLLEECNEAGGKQISGFTPDAMDQLAVMPWRRNVAELAEVVHAAWQDANGPLITLDELPERVRLIESATSHPIDEPEPIELDRFLEDVERELIEQAMRSARNNKAQAARLLSISRARLLRRLAQLGLDEVSQSPIIEN